MRPGRKRALVLLAALVGANLAAYFAFTLPRSLRRRNLDSRLQSARQEVQAERQKLKDLKGRFELLAANRKDATDFYRVHAGPRGGSLVPVLTEIEGLARDHGLTVGNQTFEMEPVKGAPLDRFFFKMPVRGTYHELVAFVHALERSQRFITLDEITVRGQQGSEAELSMVLSCYFNSVPGRQGT
jgi:Tfp pilus assembly protein PilO